MNALENSDNYLPCDQLLDGILSKSKENFMRENKDISEIEHEGFLNACLQFHKKDFLYVYENSPITQRLVQGFKVFEFCQS